MKNTITTRFSEKQSQIDLRKTEFIERYPSIWSGIIDEWRRDSEQNAGWIMYSANYLFCTGNIRWAVDPLEANWRVHSVQQMDLKHDLRDLAFVLLTHDHKDHLDLDLIKALKEYPIRWIIPEFMLAKVQRETNLMPEKIIIPQPLQPIHLQGAAILPFEGQHLVTHPEGSKTGVPEMGYLVEFSGKHLLFPADTRIYDNRLFPQFSKVDLLFAHLWLGRGKALEEDVERISSFCDFCAGFCPERVFITHLEEFGRDAHDFLDAGHARKVQKIFAEKFPSIPCTPLFAGDRVLL